MKCSQSPVAHLPNLPTDFNHRLFNMTRSHNRNASQIRPVKITRRYTKHADGAVLIESGDTQIICTASISEKVPPFLKGKNQGWLTAEYGMLPCSTNERMLREAARGKQSGRTMEIQRLIGRSLRAIIDLTMLGERTIQIDCDVTKPMAAPGQQVLLVHLSLYMTPLKVFYINSLLKQHRYLIISPLSR